MTRRKRGQPMARITDPLTGVSKEKGVTDLTQAPPDPDSEPPLSTPLVSAASYGKRVDEKRQRLAAAKSKKIQFGHAPPIPEGKLQPIADAARASRLPAPDFGLSEPGPGPAPTDEELKEWAPPPTPPPIQGVGSGYPVNQAIARGETKRPVSMKEAKQMTEELRARRQSNDVVDVPPEPTPESEETEEEEREALPAARENLDEAEKELAESPLAFFDVEGIQQARIPLLDKERKKVIEERLAPLKFEHLITKREITQIVPVIPGQFEIELRTVREKEHLWILQYLYEKAGVTSPAHVDELNSVCRLTCAVKGINGRQLPEHRENVGETGEAINEEAFEKKLEIILGFPTQVVADFGVQFNWFSDRVTALFSVEKLKNG